uniref:interleukin-1 receptor-associated kinase 4 n=1 Tax=Ciona intestinalis TaxID=7719 RepID=UPI000521999F|nr:interleukin-1 receptor-associated kinase 4 [Ciona intestinalis]|eukprot:XP_009859368.1 interleukin-1 receptor-associated kinase 4 [Ciona intestinalis]
MSWGWGSFQTPRKQVTAQTYIRNLPYSVLKSIADDLDTAGTATNWRDFVLKIPRGPNDPEPRYQLQDIRKFEMIAGRGDSPTTAAIDAWSTSNATVQDLINVLTSLGLISMVNMLKSQVTMPPPYEEAVNREQTQSTLPYPQQAQYRPVPTPVGQPYQPYPNHNIHQPVYNYESHRSSHPPIPPRPSIFSDFASIRQPTRPNEQKSYQVGSSEKSLTRQPTENDSALSVGNKLEEEQKSELAFLLQGLNLNANAVSPYSYSSLKMLTSDFNDSLKLGEGAFGSVFQGHLTQPKDGDSLERKIAIKRLKLDTPEFATAITEQFKKEVHVISELQHENILPLMGYSCDGPELCLVYDYMFNGSLSSSLESCRLGKVVLLVGQRLEIAKGSSNGISYLHEQKLIHRDIKSSNILLDSNMKPRISDFGLIRSTSTKTVDLTSTKTTNPIGTMVYMSPEAFKGVVSYSMDVYSFGVVLLELLTGLPVLDENRDPSHLPMFIEESMEEDETSLSMFADTRAGPWSNGVDDSIYELSSQCLDFRYKRRPTMHKVLSELSAMLCKTEDPQR